MAATLHLYTRSQEPIHKETSEGKVEDQTNGIVQGHSIASSPGLASRLSCVRKFSQLLLREQNCSTSALSQRARPRTGLVCISRVLVRAGMGSFTNDGYTHLDPNSSFQGAVRLNSLLLSPCCSHSHVLHCSLSHWQRGNENRVKP
jgi:hypothetical protein